MAYNKNSHTHVHRASPGFTLEGVLLFIIFGLILGGLILYYAPANGPTEVISQTQESRFQKEVVVHNLSMSGKTAAIWMAEIPGNPMSVVEHIWTDKYDNILIAGAESFSELKKIGKLNSIEVRGLLSTGQKVGLWYIFVKKQLRNGESYEEVESIEIRSLEKTD